GGERPCDEVGVAADVGDRPGVAGAAGQAGGDEQAPVAELAVNGFDVDVLDDPDLARAAHPQLGHAGPVMFDPQGDLPEPTPRRWRGGPQYQAQFSGCYGQPQSSEPSP